MLQLAAFQTPAPGTTFTLALQPWVPIPPLPSANQESLQLLNWAGFSFKCCLLHWGRAVSRGL